MSERLLIERLGARGDGIARDRGAPVYVPGALPGETVEAERRGERARLVAVETPSPERATPFCPYFGACGGCAAQHMGQELYAAWKRGKLVAALAAARLEAEVEALVDAHGAGRRRLTLHARRRGGEVLVGYMAARSHDLVAIDHCPIAEPALEGAPRAAALLATRLNSRKPLDIQVTATGGGLDVDLRGHGPASAAERQRLIEAAGEADLARLSLHGEVLVERRPPALAMGRATVVPPPGGFLQATAAGEECLADLVLSGCGAARRVADLFCGCGPFALRLAERAAVHAADLDPGGLRALERAGRATPGLRPVVTERRNLLQRPLLPPELERFDAVVLDPPRAGAEAQMRQLASSTIPVVVSVSCDPGSFARDAAILVAGGYRPERIVPVDQFKFSPHLEVVGVFRQGGPRRRR